ncbi:MAG: hypothetical protein QG635_715 [Bacteroidota bacterium]|nr:hypothetical protein [Bacteroidota bacterium]
MESFSNGLYALIIIIIFLILEKKRAKKNQEKLLKSNDLIKTEFIEKPIIIDDNIIDNYELDEIFKPMYNLIDMNLNDYSYYYSKKNFTKQQVYANAISCYLYEVENGGHYQFYYNSAGLLWEDASNGFIELDLSEISDIILESVKRFRGHPSTDILKRRDQLIYFKINFEDLDTRLYKIEEEFDIEGIMLDFVRNNRQYFYFDGKYKIPYNKN